jgi:excisionase family DNA binding protein
MESLTVAPTMATSSGSVGTRPLLVSAHEAARMLGIGRTTLYELVKLDLVTPVHIGRCVRFSFVELESYVERLVTEASRPATQYDKRVSADAPMEPTLF